MIPVRIICDRLSTKFLSLYVFFIYFPCLCAVLTLFLMQPKKRGRQKGSKNKPNREVVQKLGEATLYYAHGRYEEVICSVK